MRQVIQQLNDMSFTLPDNWRVSSDVYHLPNGQGMQNLQNYISDRGEVLSLFSVMKDPDEFLEGYAAAAQNPDNVSGRYSITNCPSISCNGFVFPCYIVRGAKDEHLSMLQVFVNCGDRLAAFMLNVEISGSFSSALKSQSVLKDLVKILRTVE